MGGFTYLVEIVMDKQKFVLILFSDSLFIQHDIISIFLNKSTKFYFLIFPLSSNLQNRSFILTKILNFWCYHIVGYGECIKNSRATIFDYHCFMEKIAKYWFSKFLLFSLQFFILKAFDSNFFEISAINYSKLLCQIYGKRLRREKSYHTKTWKIYAFTKPIVSKPNWLLEN